jgi:glycerol-3-phosphate dehydrogenase
MNVVPTRPIQPVPTDKTKGIFVYSTLYDQIVVGPTAKDQLSRTDSHIEPEVADILANYASRILGRQMGKSKHDTNVVGEYVGIRPGTSKRDYQIHLYHAAKFFTVGGIRSTGLTASIGIGKHVVQCILPTIVPMPKLTCNLQNQLAPIPLPDVKELVEQYHRRNDGTVEIDCNSYKVTHPLTKLGWEARSGLARM